MSEYKRVSGKLHNIEESLANRAAIELIDDYQMNIYELMKLIDKDMVGYIATCEEIFDDKGEVIDVRTKFRMIRPEEEE
ncbi:MAG: hypothetical protein IIZ78_00695 [Clostridiales bacterium]|nr:hypothetical protein [Clostridiales bacterium]